MSQYQYKGRKRHGEHAHGRNEIYLKRAHGTERVQNGFYYNSAAHAAGSPGAGGE